jgi:hypothetical protein
VSRSLNATVPRAVGAGALHPNPDQLTESPQPPSQGRIAHRGRRELAVTDLPAQIIDHRDIMGLAMGVDATDDNLGSPVMRDIAAPLSARTGWVSALRSGAPDKTVIVPLAQALSGHAARPHTQTTPPAPRSTNPGQDSNIASVDGGSHPERAVPPTSHLTVKRDGATFPPSKSHDHCSLSNHIPRQPVGQHPTDLIHCNDATQVDHGAPRSAAPRSCPMQP